MANYNEAMDWESMYQKNEFPWDHGEGCPGLDEWLKLNPNRMSGRILVPGCGRGHDVRLIASRCPDAEVVGLDISPTAVELARAMDNPRNAEFAEGNFFDANHSDHGTFDWIWEHTCFCAIPVEWRPQYVTACNRFLNDSGQYLAIFYLNPELDDDHQGPPFGCTNKEIDDLFGAYFVPGAPFPPARAYESRIGRESMRLMQKLP